MSIILNFKNIISAVAFSYCRFNIFKTTNKGEIPIEHVSIGMFVLTHNGRFRKVTATGAKEAETIILRDEHEHTLECTPNHPI